MAGTVFQEEFTDLAGHEANASSWLHRTLQLLDRQIRSSTNRYGTAALRDTGTSEGNLPLIGTNNRLDGGVLPPATTESAGAVELATNAEVASGSSDRALTPNGLLSLSATESRRGVARFASSAQAIAGNDDTKAVSPSAASVAQDDVRTFAAQEVARIPNHGEDPAIICYNLGVDVSQFETLTVTLLWQNNSVMGQTTLHVDDIPVQAAAGERVSGLPFASVFAFGNTPVQGAPVSMSDSGRDFAEAYGAYSDSFQAELGTDQETGGIDWGGFEDEEEEDLGISFSTPPDTTIDQGVYQDEGIEFAQPDIQDQMDDVETAPQPTPSPGTTPDPGGTPDPGDQPGVPPTTPDPGEPPDIPDVSNTPADPAHEFLTQQDARLGPAIVQVPGTGTGVFMGGLTPQENARLQQKIGKIGILSAVLAPAAALAPVNTALTTVASKFLDGKFIDTLIGEQGSGGATSYDALTTDQRQALSDLSSLSGLDPDNMDDDDDDDQGGDDDADDGFGNDPDGEWTGP